MAMVVAFPPHSSTFLKHRSDSNNTCHLRRNPWGSLTALLSVTSPADAVGSLTNLQTPHSSISYHSFAVGSKTLAFVLAAAALPPPRPQVVAFPQPRPGSHAGATSPERHAHGVRILQMESRALRTSSRVG